MTMKLYYCNLNLKGLDKQNEDNNESSLVLEYIYDALANNYNTIRSFNQSYGTI